MAATIGPLLPNELPRLDDALASLLHGVKPDFLWQAQRMPVISRRLLLEHASPRSTPPQVLLDELQMPAETVTLGARVLRTSNVLPPETCEQLRGVVDREHRDKVDTVDGAPDHRTAVALELTLPPLCTSRCVTSPLTAAEVNLSHERLLEL